MITPYYEIRHWSVIFLVEVFQKMVQFIYLFLYLILFFLIELRGRFENR